MMHHPFTKPAIAIAMLLSGLTTTSSLLAANKGLAYVSNQNGGVSVIDLDSFAVSGFINIDAKSPRGIGITADGKTLVTANKDDGNISIVDIPSGRLLRHIAIGKNPEFVRVVGDHAYVSYEPSSKGGRPKTAKEDDDDDNGPQERARIAIVDLNTGKVMKEIIGGPETEGIEFSKDGKKLIITNEADNTITIHDLKSGKLLQTISTSKYGERPRGIKVSPDGKFAVTTLELGNKLLKLDTKFKPVKAIKTGQGPYGVAFDRGGKRLFVAASKDKLLQVFDASTLELVKNIPVSERCWHFSFTPDESQLLLACGKSDEILVIDAHKLEVTKHIVNKDTPWGVITYPKSMGSLDTP